jgi:hypothetical protein
MTLETDALIRRLAEASVPVRRLAAPWIRTLVWLAIGVLYVALVVIVASPRGDLLQKISEWRFVVEEAAALATGIAAAIAAFATVVPGFSRKLLLLPMLTLAVWLGTLGQGCIQNWIRLGPDGVSLQPDWFCFPAIVLVGAVPAIAMAAMVRRGAPLTPHLTAALGGLAAAGIGNFGLRFFHPQDASLMVLVWQFGTVVVLSAIAGLAGRYVLSWRAVIGGSARPAG